MVKGEEIMRIVKLDEASKKNILTDLLKRSPNNYGSYNDSVNEIHLIMLKKMETRLFLNIQQNLTRQILMRIIS